MAKQVNQPENKQPEVLRLHEATSTNTHWHQTGKMNELQIESIKDPAGSFHGIPVTSIPSPFARIHLTEDAFKKINQATAGNQSKLVGNTIHHKLVSETFDLAELFFNIDDFKSSGLQLDLLQWNIKDKIVTLKSKAEHRLLGETLELFLKQSPADSGLRSLENIYIMRLGYKPIGGTSPSTLFFSTPNDSHLHTAQPIKTGDDVLFDVEFCPLYKRDAAFLKYIYLLFEVNPQMKTAMSLMWKHLEINLIVLQNANYALWNEIVQIQHLGQTGAMQKMQTEYAVANFAGDGTFVYPIPGVMLHKRRGGSGAVASDFEIGSYTRPGEGNSKTAMAQKPLVLQNQFHMPLNYFKGKWDAKTTVPYKDDIAVSERILPGLHTKYPYLTVSDFLEPYLLRLPFMLNAERYFNGNLQGFNSGNKTENIAPDHNFALPLTKRFFEFFDVEDLRRNLPSGEPVFRMIKLDDNSVKVELRVPIKASGIYITMERTYRYGHVPKIDSQFNDGAIVDCAFNVGIMPFVRNVVNQRIVILEREQQQMQPYQVAFYDQKNPEPLKIESQKVRSDLAKGHQATSSYYDVDLSFDYIHIAKNLNAGIIVPIFPNHVEGGKSFTFSVDFGTTNSHIEYSVDGSVPQPFDVTAKDVQLVTMQDPKWDIVAAREIQGYFLYEMIPSEIGGEFCFPSRTALAEIHDLPWAGSVMPFGDFNPAFYYQKYRSLPQSDINTNLKWGYNQAGDFAAQGRIRGYLESLMLMMRNKVLLNGGRLSQTQIVWFYPASMSHFTKSGLVTIWSELVKTYFNTGQGQVHSYSESESPYYIHAATKPSIHPSVNIDIGGGTTDVSIFINEQPKYHTSFRFAGNTLFSNGYQQGKGLENGFVKAFSPVVKSFLDQNYYQLIDLCNVYEELSNPGTGHSSDLLSFFFSIEGNQQLKNHKLNFSFTKVLQQDQQFKIAFLLFHAAILYHTAKWMKALGLGMPQHVFYCGNGSKTIDLADLSPNKEMLIKLSVSIFESVYQQPYSFKLEMHTTDKPKDATCKGGILRLQRFNHVKEESIPTVLLGNEANTLVSEDSNEPIFQRVYYKDVINNQETKNSVLAECRNFLNIVLNSEQYRTLANLGIPVGKIEPYKQNLESSLDAYLQSGINERMRATDAAQTLEESMFFYPLFGALHNLVLDISTGKV